MLKAEILNQQDPNQWEEYESFVQQHEYGSYLQSLRWVKVKPNWGNCAVVVRDQSGAIVGSALILIKKISKLKRSLLYAPHGPVMDFAREDVWEALLQKVDELAKQHRSFLFRMDPLFEHDDTEKIEQFTRFGFAFKKNPKERTTFQGHINYVLDLGGKTKEEIFESFHSKWRYNIRLAERKGVRCIVGGPEHLDDFYPLMEETGKRDGFTIRDKAYFLRMMEALGEHCRLYLCYCEDKPLSGAITVQYGHTTSYVYGASSNADRKLMPNHLMQWTMIQWAIDQGCTLYDFLGIPFYNDETHPNYGVYRFKKGFSGRVCRLVGEFDRIYHPLFGHSFRFMQYHLFVPYKKWRKKRSQKKN